LAGTCRSRNPESIFQCREGVKMQQLVRTGVSTAKRCRKAVDWSWVTAGLICTVLMGSFLTAVPFCLLVAGICEAPNAPKPLASAGFFGFMVLLFGGVAIGYWNMVIDDIKEWCAPKPADSFPEVVRRYLEHKRRATTARRFNWYDAAYRGDRRN
jgi:hypothetical protein